MAFITVVFLFLVIAAAVRISQIHRAQCREAEEREWEASLPIPPSSTPPAKVLDRSISCGYLPGTGAEVFFPPTTRPNPVYQVTVTGILRHKNGHHADAFHQIDGHGNYTASHDALLVNGTRLHYIPHDMTVADRFEHKYCFLLDGRGERLTLAMRFNYPSDWCGWLTVEVKLLKGTPSVALRQNQEKARAEAKIEDARISAAFAKRIAELSTRAEAFRNWEDPEYRNKFAQVHYAELIQHQGEIRAEVIAFLAQRDLVQYLRRHAPLIVARFSGRLEALQIAERVALDKRLAAEIPPAPPPKKRLTAEEVRAIKIHRQQVQDGDKVALKLDKIETRLHVRERLDKMHLDPDEREMLEQELLSEIDEGDEHDNTKTI
jgi:hypothetical protein